jgi:glycosyltransferase involved in cell wall biosynthesis
LCSCIGGSMKTCVYTITKNEEHNVDSFMEGANEADIIVILDTGSTDKTIEKFKQYEKVIIKQKTFEPFDFSKARNEALSLVPEDINICISIDLDETMEKGWSEALKKEWKEDTIIGSYWYHSTLDENKNPLVECWRTKIHSRHDFRWERPIHEMIVTDKKEGGQVFVKDFIVKHHRKHPSNYENYLNDFIEQNPTNKESYMQRAGDRVDKGKFQEANEDYLKYIELTNNIDKDFKIIVDRAICFLSIAKNYYHINQDLGLVQQYLLKSVAEFPNYRDGWVYLAEFYNGVQDYPMAYACAIKALNIKENYGYVVETKCWGEYPKQLANIALKQIYGVIDNGNIIR